MKTYTYFVGIPHASLSSLAEVVSRYTKGATIIPGYGLWEGTLEQQFTVSIYGLIPTKAMDLANDLTVAFSQESVMVQSDRPDTRFVERQAG